MENKAVHISLLENSHAFFVEAVHKAIGATDDTRQWQFAILNLVQSLELSLKALLQEIHPVFIYENVDSRNSNTVSVTKAIDRLCDKGIGNVHFTKKERDGMKSAIEFRNKVTHSEFVLKKEHAEAQFFSVFRLLMSFQQKYLKSTVEDILSRQIITELLNIEKSKKALVDIALAKIKDENVSADSVLTCFNCLANTFVFKDTEGVCYTCSEIGLVHNCSNCSLVFYEYELTPIECQLDTQFDEGRTIVENNYGYDENLLLCGECTEKIIEDIEYKRFEERSERHEAELLYNNEY